MSDEQWPVRIIVLDRGFVYACRCPDPQQHALWLPYTHRRTVRRWGTTRGLGELVGGPLADTVLDAVVLLAAWCRRWRLRARDAEAALAFLAARGRGGP